MRISLEDLQEWDRKILELVEYYGLNCYPQEFEICDHWDMLGYMAYSGMPAHYAHWSYGKSYERQKTMYDYGAAGLPYEMVINSDPCLAYLMKDNTPLLQILTIAHVYGHNDFFANNFTFTSGTEAKYTLERFKSGATRIDSYIEDPSIGIEEVERILDSAHSIQFNRSNNLAITKLSHQEQRRRKWEEYNKPKDEHWEIHPTEETEAPNLDKIPPSPESDVLLFIAEYNRFAPDWAKDIMRIVDFQASYFIPQIETKIMNEGWASYWHHKILNELKLDSGLHLEFLVRHNQVLRPHPGSINPYHLGFQMWHDIERRWNQGETGIEYRDDSPPSTWDDERESPGRKKIFEIRKGDRDASFLRRFLTPELMRELNLFQHEKRGKDRIVTRVADDDSWEEIKETLIKNTGTGSFPKITVEDADFGRKRTLYLKHDYDGRELLIEYAEHTLKHLQTLWSHEVVLESVLKGKRALFKLEKGKVKVEKL